MKPPWLLHSPMMTAGRCARHRCFRESDHTRPSPGEKCTSVQGNVLIWILHGLLSYEVSGNLDDVNISYDNQVFTISNIFRRYPSIISSKFRRRQVCIRLLCFTQFNRYASIYCVLPNSISCGNAGTWARKKLRRVPRSCDLVGVSFDSDLSPPTFRSSWLLLDVTYFHRTKHISPLPPCTTT